jgi:hypothetical protein
VVEPSSDPVQLQVHGTCGQTLVVDVEGVKVSFTCSPGEQPVSQLDPGFFSGGHTALVLESEVLGRLAASHEFVASADPLVIPVQSGTTIALADWTQSIDEALDAGKPIRLEVRPE